jgi:hypothetical protein
MSLVPIKPLLLDLRANARYAETASTAKNTHRIKKSTEIGDICINIV